MKKILLLWLMLVPLGLSQINSKWLSPTDSVLQKNSQGVWLEIIVVDSSTADTAYYEEPTYAGGWAGVAVKDLSNDEIIENGVLAPGTGINGKKYLVWKPYPRTFRIRLSDYSSDGIWVRTTEKPD